MPTGGKAQNCAALDVDLHYYFNDVECNMAYMAICEKQENQVTLPCSDAEKL